MAQLLQVGVVDKAERVKSKTSGLLECHIHLVDRAGKDFTLVLPEREAARLYSLLGVAVKR